MADRFKPTLTAVFGERCTEFSPSLLTLLRSFYKRAQEDALHELEPEISARIQSQESELRIHLDRHQHTILVLQRVLESSPDSPVAAELRHVLHVLHVLHELQDFR